MCWYGWCLDKGDRIPQPTNIPAVIDKVTGKPMMTPDIGLLIHYSSLHSPCPTYDRDGVNLPVSHVLYTLIMTHHHIQLEARLTPNGYPRTSNTGIANMTGNQKLAIYFVSLISPFKKKHTVMNPLEAKLHPKARHPPPPIISLCS